MAVLIKGMEMPENCICCDLSHEDGWCPAKQTYTDRYTFKTCPLVPVPSHGRLIDADEPISLVDTHRREVETTVAHIIERNCGIIKVIIPAEEDET